MAEALDGRANIAGLPAEADGILSDVRIVSLALGAVSLPLAMLLDAVPLWLMAVAVGLALLIWFHPQEAAPAGILFMFLGSVVLPVPRGDAPAQTPLEMYYWACGLLIITGAGVARLGSRVFQIPTSAKTFLAVGVLAAIYGLAQGISLGYVLRQVYGILLLIAYLTIAVHFGSESLLVRRLQTYGFVCALVFFTYYLAVFAKYGIEKQLNPAGPGAALLATVLLTSGLNNRKLGRVAVALILMVVPALLLARSAFLTPLVAALLVVALGATSRAVKLFFFVGAIGLGLVGLVPAIANNIGDSISTALGPNSAVPLEIFHADTLVGRVMQLASALTTLRAHPLLGAGLGSNFEWFEPGFGWMEAAFVDNGWAYLLAKTGMVGLVSFLWFLGTVSRRISKQTAALSACFLTITLVTMFSQACYFHFTQAPLTGTIVGLLLAKNNRKTV